MRIVSPRRTMIVFCLVFVKSYNEDETIFAPVGL